MKKVKKKIKKRKLTKRTNKKDDKTKYSIICYYSCKVFLLNILISLYYDYYIYSGLFFVLFLTSLLFHSNPTHFTGIIDKISISSVVMYGGYVFLNKLLNINIQDTKRIIFSIIIMMTFLTIIFWYVYGYYKNKYCFYKKQHGFLYHMLVHIISSLGHILIVIL